MNTFISAKPLPQQVPAFPRNKVVLSAVFARVRADFPAVAGLTHVTPTVAVFQVAGDATRYCVDVTADEAAALGYVA